MNTYQFQLLKGSFAKEDAMALLTRMIDVKIKYHEDKIQQSDNEEDIKMRENRIKQLQHDLSAIRKHSVHKAGRVELNSQITIA